MNPLLIGQAEEIDLIQPQVREMLERPGFYIGGDSPAQEAILLTRTAAGWQRESLFDTDISYLHGAEPKPAFVL